MAAQRGYKITQEYTDRISGAKARRLGLDKSRMTENTIVFLGCLAVIVLLGILIYVSSRCPGNLPSSISANFAGHWTSSWQAAATSNRPWHSTAAFSTTPTSKSMPFQKASKNPPANSHKINGRIEEIRPFQRVWVGERIERQENTSCHGCFWPMTSRSLYRFLQLPRLPNC